MSNPEKASKLPKVRRIKIRRGLGRVFLTTESLSGEPTPLEFKKDNAAKILGANATMSVETGPTPSPQIIPDLQQEITNPKPEAV